MGYLCVSRRVPWETMVETKRLVDVLPPEFMNGEYEDSPAMPLAFTDVVASYRDEPRWPGNHRYVHAWFVLSNGKAVGWNENPQRGWSFPVISYAHTKQEPVTAPLVLRFQNVQHTAYHHVLTQNGFSFTVSSDLVIGFDYRHPATGIGVVLKPVDDDLEYACLKPDGVHVYTRDDYSIDEWRWVEDSSDDVEHLMRDLFILINTRPATMYFPKNKGAAK